MQLKQIHFLSRRLISAGFLASALLLTGCGSEGPTADLNSVEPTTEQQAQTSGFVVMDFTNGNIPFPHDALFSGSTDGTLNMPVADESDYSDPKVAMNAVDGFSTSAPMTFSLNTALNTTDANANTIADVLEAGLAIYETVADPQTKAVGAISTRLMPGVDYVPVVTDVSAQTIAIIPLRPLKPKTTYLVTLDNTVLDAENKPLDKGFVYSALSSTQSLLGSGLEALEPLRQLTNAHRYALSNAQVATDSIIASWSFTTQSTADVLQATTTNVSNNSLMVANTTLDTSVFGGLGAAQVYAGSVTVPYYGGVPSAENPVAALNTFWSGMGGSMLSQFNPQPVATSEQTIPVLMTLPKTGVKPDAGWPVVIFQHGITGNRANVLAVADALAMAGFAAVAIDMPLHGIEPDSALAVLRNAQVGERTFDVDYVTQDSNEGVSAAVPDGVVDSSGRHFINLSHLVVTRDNLRQAVSDLTQLQASLESAAVNGLLDASNVSFVGHSLGAMVGGVHQALSPANAAVFAMPGVQASYLLASSPTFGPEIAAGLAAQGVSVGSSEFSQFLLAAQTVVDSADPVNYVANIAAPSLLFEVVGDGVDPAMQDQVIPNAVATAPLAGTEPWIALQGLNDVMGTSAVTDGKGVIRFSAGSHKSLLLADNGDATVRTTMQEAMASFLATQGAAVQVSDESTIRQ